MLRRTPDAGSPASDAELVPSSRARAWLALGIAGVRAFALCLIVLAVRLNEVAGGRTYSEVSDATRRLVMTGRRFDSDRRLQVDSRPFGHGPDEA